MKRLLMMFGFVLVVLFSAPPSKAQVNVIRKERCQALACVLYWWTPIYDGDTMVVIVRPVTVSGIMTFMVADNRGNSYQSPYAYYAYPGFSKVFVAFNVKGRMNDVVDPPFVIGIVAANGLGDYGGAINTGSLLVDVLIIELPPAAGFAAPSVAAGYFRGGGSDDIGVNPSINLTLPNPGKTVLLGWSVLRWYGNAPLQASYLAPWNLIKDDGYISVATQEVYNSGIYDLVGSYNGYGFWDAGIVALAMK